LWSRLLAAKTRHLWFFQSWRFEDIVEKYDLKNWPGSFPAMAWSRRAANLAQQLTLCKIPVKLGESQQAKRDKAIRQ